MYATYSALEVAAMIGVLDWQYEYKDVVGNSNHQAFATYTSYQMMANYAIYEYYNMEDLIIMKSMVQLHGGILLLLNHNNLQQNLVSRNAVLASLKGMELGLAGTKKVKSGIAGLIGFGLNSGVIVYKGATRVSSFAMAELMVRVNRMIDNNVSDTLLEDVDRYLGIEDRNEWVGTGALINRLQTKPFISTYMRIQRQSHI
jgi:hypothetical protein